MHSKLQKSLIKKHTKIFTRKSKISGHRLNYETSFDFLSKKKKMTSEKKKFISSILLSVGCIFHLPWCQTWCIPGLSSKQWFRFASFPEFQISNFQSNYEHGYREHSKLFSSTVQIQDVLLNLKDYLRVNLYQF